MIRPSDSNTTRNTIKFLYSYGGKVLPRPTDGRLRYVGGCTRVLAVDRSITYAELMVKFGELCGSSMNLKCKLPDEDLDLLVTITCDEDLASAIEEYDRVSRSSNKDMKIRVIIFPHKSLKKISPPSSPSTSASCLDYFPSNQQLFQLINRPVIYRYINVICRRSDSPWVLRRPAQRSSLGNGTLFGGGIGGYS